MLEHTFIAKSYQIRNVPICFDEQVDFLKRLTKKSIILLHQLSGNFKKQFALQKHPRCIYQINGKTI